MKRRMCVAAAIIAVGLLAAGCRGDLDSADFKKAAADSGPSCADAQSWKVDPESDDGQTAAALYEVDSEQNGCYDEIGFDFNTEDHVGYRARYTDHPTQADGSPMPLPSGNRFLQIDVFASAPEGTQSDLANGQEVSLQGDTEKYGAIKDVLFGGSVEDHSTFVVGVDDVHPFQVTSDDDGALTSVVVRIAHPPTAP